MAGICFFDGAVRWIYIGKDDKPVSECPALNIRLNKEKEDGYEF